MRFTKMQGAGNDYVYVDCFNEPIPDQPAELARRIARPPRIHRAVGCMECRMTGFMGRIGLYEILLMSPEIRRAVSSEVDLARVRELAIREGMRPLRLSGAAKVAAGITTLEEVVKVAPPADDEGH